MKIFRLKQIFILAAAITAFAAWTPAASDNSTVRLVLTALLNCDGSGPGSVISNGHPVLGTNPCPSSGTLPAIGSSATGATSRENAPQSAGSSPSGEAVPANASRGTGAPGIVTPVGALLLSFEGGEVEIVIVFLCRGT
ncbi:MAG TPA: hypothetical protein VEG64_05745 [Candidatus Sulfotelmatobacter sp.]|nr:hypothetical protein [Candidatus Sulfotelmatobacter sp.]